jgi:large subunit ribosomal protein L22
MGKKPHPGLLAENETMAVLRNVRVSPRKLDLVAALIRGKPAAKAMAELQFSKRRIALNVRKLLQSAIANAENNHQLDVDRLEIKEASVGKALVMRRFHARGRGRSSKVQKFFSHLRLVLRETAAPTAVPTPKEKPAETT